MFTVSESNLSAGYQTTVTLAICASQEEKHMRGGGDHSEAGLLISISVMGAARHMAAVGSVATPGVEGRGASARLRRPNRPMASSFHIKDKASVNLSLCFAPVV